MLLCWVGGVGVGVCSGCVGVGVGGVRWVGWGGVGVRAWWVVEGGGRRHPETSCTCMVAVV